VQFGTSCRNAIVFQLLCMKAVLTSGNRHTFHTSTVKMFFERYYISNAWSYIHELYSISILIENHSLTNSIWSNWYYMTTYYIYIYIYHNISTSSKVHKIYIYKYHLFTASSYKLSSHSASVKTWQMPFYQYNFIIDLGIIYQDQVKSV